MVPTTIVVVELPLAPLNQGGGGGGGDRGRTGVRGGGDGASRWGAPGGDGISGGGAGGAGGGYIGAEAITAGVSSQGAGLNFRVDAAALVFGQGWPICGEIQ